MRIEALEIRNYRVFREARFGGLPRLAVVVGANGSGKSTLFDVFMFLRDALTQNVAQAVAWRGGFKELMSRGEQGPIGITLKFRESGGRLATYRLEIASEEGRPVVHREVLTFRRGQSRKPWHFVDFSRGRGTAVTNEEAYGEEGVEAERQEGVLDDPSALAIKGLGQFKEFRVVAELRSMIENWHVSAPRGDIAQAAKCLYEHHPDRFDKVLGVMRQRAPGMSKLEAKRTEDGRVALRCEDGAFRDPFLARLNSDGAIKMFAYLLLLYHPQPAALLAIVTPECHLHPQLLGDLVEEFRAYARRGGQILVSTHSPEFLNDTKLDEVYLFVKQQGFVTVKRPSESDLLRTLVDEGDLPGALWKQGLFEEASPR